MKTILFAFLGSLCLIVTCSLHSQNLVSRDGFFNSLALDPVLTIYNNSQEAFECVVIDYRVDGSELMHYKSQGVLPGMTSVEVSLPRIMVSHGYHAFDATLKSANGKSLNDVTVVKNLTFLLSPGSQVTSGEKALKSQKQQETSTGGCSCMNGEGLNENISFWFSIYRDDSDKMRASGSTDKGQAWTRGEWDPTGKNVNEGTFKFKDRSDQGRSLAIIISSTPLAPIVDAETGELTPTPGIEVVAVFPNPFIDQINIRYQVSESNEVNMKIIDSQGKVIGVPINLIRHNVGTYSYVYNNSLLPVGVYYFIITIGGKEYLKKVIKY